jgi:hypothetical protein
MFSLRRFLKLGYVLLLGTVILVLSQPTPARAQRTLVAPQLNVGPGAILQQQSIAQAQLMLSLAGLPKSPGTSIIGFGGISALFPGVGLMGFGQLGGVGQLGGFGLAGGFNGFGLGGFGLAGGFNGFGLGGFGLAGGQWFRSSRRLQWFRIGRGGRLRRQRLRRLQRSQAALNRFSRPRIPYH